MQRLISGRPIGFVVSVLLAAGVLSPQPAMGSSTVDSARASLDAADRPVQDAAPPQSELVLISGIAQPVNPDGSLGPPLPIQESRRPAAAENCKDTGAIEGPVVTPMNTAFEACECPPNDQCWIGYLVGDGPFTTTFVAESLSSGEVAVVGPTLYVCSGGCAFEQGGGGVGWLALWWTVDSDAGAGVYDQWCM